eukprot:CAMPEP_0202909538 /NCGR_PEP_ID=MMETSP1392-20130828/49601_1 /ASSEMBLY_ACC=CAM_ASM_000868 /TAXON_ID=225041 /ORGANISM="Chlamydomonas chlamydogama, Strain SAG 11-48b" /LENGTH=92 /DNA_ID=CAMNT_0049599329 /DNA_START=19 /DNA_END=293 /DNA_ORIENTATION=-
MANASYDVVATLTAKPTDQAGSLLKVQPQKPVCDQEVRLNDNVVITQSKLDNIMAVNDGWPFPAEKDGMLLVHNAIRLDLSDVDQALTALLT